MGGMEEWKKGKGGMKTQHENTTSIHTKKMDSHTYASTTKGIKLI
jgi:hypothetical protein